VEIMCAQCGARLPQENARYCNNCGSLIPSRSSGSVSSYSTQRTPPSSSASERSGGSRPPLREQIAQQPPARPVRPSSPDHPPAWMSELERGGRRQPQADPLRMKRSLETGSGQQREASGLNRQERPPAPRGEREVEAHPPARERDVADKPTQAHVPAAEPTRRPSPPVAGTAARELRVKVWPQEDRALAAGASEPEREQRSAQNTHPAAGTANAGSNIALDDLPTRPLVANTPPSPVQRAVNPPPVSRRPESMVDDVERLDTTPLLAPEVGRGRSASPGAPVSVERAGQVEQRPWQTAGRRDTLDRPSLHSVQPVTPPSRPVVPPQQAQQLQQAQRPASPVSPVSPLPPTPVREREQTPLPPLPGPAKAEAARHAKGRKRTPFMLLAVLAILLAGGLATWIIVARPFTVPTVTQPQQAFSNTKLGFSVHYPSGWTARADTGNGTVLFSDSSHTGQVKILVAAANGDPGQYLSKEAAQLGMASVKQGKALSFAGTSWQQVQGSVQVAGANYTAVLLAAVHGNHIYTIIQMAPQATYTDEEHVIFSSMRASFRFLS